MEPLVLDFFLRTLDACYNEETIKRTLDLLIARRFRLITEEEDETYTDVVPEVSSTLQHEVDAYLAHQREGLHIQAVCLGEVEFSLILFLKEGQLRCWTFMDDILDAGDVDVVMPILINTYQDLYNVWHPFYGYEKYSGGISLNWDEITREQQIEYLYANNLFGPELVQKLGRDRLLNAPAWKSEELDDGGIFLAPVQQMASRGGGYSWKKVADYLGLQTPQAPGEEWDEIDFDEE